MKKRFIERINGKKMIILITENKTEQTDSMASDARTEF